MDELFEQLLTAKGHSKRERILEELQEELTLHAESEAQTFYAALEEHEETKDLMEHAHKEHQEIKDFIEKLKGMPVGGEKWVEQIGEFKHSVTHHVEEEEGDIFEKAKEVLDAEQAKQLAADMDALKKELAEKRKKD